MAEEITAENGRISNFEGLVTLNLTLDRVILHTVVHLSSTSTHARAKFHWNRVNFLWTYTYVRKHVRTYVGPYVMKFKFKTKK